MTVIPASLRLDGFAELTDGFFHPHWIADESGEISPEGMRSAARYPGWDPFP